MKRLSIVSATAFMVALLGSTTPVGHAEPVPSDKYIPFVTDFPKPAAGTATGEPYVPFVTDFPAPVSVSTEASTSGIDWGVGIGAGFGAALAVLLVGSGLVLTRRARPARSGPRTAG